MRLKLRLRAMALCGLLLGLMAFTADTAHAEEGAHIWVVNAEGQLKDLSVQIEADADTTMTLTSKIAGISVVFSCTKIALSGVKTIAGTGTSEKGGKIIFTGCTTKLNGTTSTPCEPVDEGKKGTIVTSPGEFLVKLDVLMPGGATHDVLESFPDSGETYATIKMGEECSIGTKVPVIGAGVQVKDCMDQFLVHKVKHLVEKILGQLWVISKTVEHQASLGGSAIIYLIGIHNGLQWSIDPL
jgi:hypothetical protein